MRIRYYIAEPMRLRRLGLCNCLAAADDLACVGETGCADEVLAAVRRLAPDVVVLSAEWARPGRNDLLSGLVAAPPAPAVIVVAASEDPREAEASLGRGATGFLTEAETDPKRLTAAVRQVASGEVVLNAKLLAEVFPRRLCPARTTHTPKTQISAREGEVLALTARGLEAKEIADRLSISARTVDVHRANIRNKLGLRGTHELMRYAMAWTRDSHQPLLRRHFARDRRPVLVVEDDEVDILSIQRAIDTLRGGVSAVIARNGEEALAYLRSPDLIRPALVLLDLKMPRMNGFEFLAEVRKDPALSSVPIIVLTSSQQEEDIARSYALGLAGYLVKPSDSAEFIEMFRILAQYWVMNELPAATPAATLAPALD